jgi:hypothetical protein
MFTQRPFHFSNSNRRAAVSEHQNQKRNGHLDPEVVKNVSGLDGVWTLLSFIPSNALEEA